MTGITETQLAEWQALADAATPGPWFHCRPFQVVKIWNSRQIEP